jgi:hypothetical protein
MTSCTCQWFENQVCDVCQGIEAPVVNPADTRECDGYPALADLCVCGPMTTALGYCECGADPDSCPCGDPGDCGECA